MTTTRCIRIGDREVARIGLGTNRLTHTQEHVDLVRAAVDAGIGCIDSAHAYTGGQSETTIGAALDGKSHGTVVATKGGHAPGHARPEVLRSQIEESLRRLRTDCIELYYLHRVDPETPLEESLGEIRRHVDAGSIRHVGLSQVSVEQIERAQTVAPVTAVQNHYNLSERGFDDVLDHCTRERIVFVPYFPLRGDAPGSVRDVAQRHQAKPSQIALAWLLRRSPMTLPIPGTLSLEHLRENLGALDIELTDEEFQALS